MKKINVVICVFLFLGISTQAQLTVSTHVNTEVICHGGSNGNITATPSGGTSPYTYSWSPGSQTTATIGGLTAGTYTIHVTDHASLTASATATVTQPAALTIALTATYTAVCPGKSDSLFAAVSGGTAPYTYSWTAPFGDISNPSAARVNSYPYGSPYSFAGSEVVDKMGCSNTASINITVYPFPYVTVYGAISPIAPGRSDTLVASAVGATYLWSNSSTTSSIIVSPSISTTYTVKAKNTYGCYDTARYTIDTERVGNGTSSSNAIPVVQNSTVSLSSFSNYSTYDSIVWFSFVAQDSNAQIIANSAFLGMPVPHVHRLTLYNGSLNTVVDENMPDITGANQIRIDISHLKIDSTYYVRASRTPAHSNMPGCNPNSAGECNPSQRWSFQMCFRTLNIFVPDDSGSEAPSPNQVYYESRGQIEDLNNIPRFDIKAYTNNTKPNVFCSDSGISFVYQHIDSAKSFMDTVQRVDMVLVGSGIQAPQPVFKMQEDSAAGYLNYFLGFVPNGVPKVEGYSRLVYKNVYPNVDAHIFSNGDGTKIYFVCNPASGTGGSAGNPANIELKFKGATSVSITGSGDLKISTELGSFYFAPGDAYTDSLGVIKQKSWQPYFITVNSTTVRFNTGAYNSNEPLVIRIDRGHSASGSHPAIQNLDWSTYFGGTDYQAIFNNVCSDKHGNVYAVGATQSAQYPVTTGVFQDTLYDNEPQYVNSTVAKFDSTDARKWATYYGGQYETYGYGICVNDTGTIYITGTTQSWNLPMASYPSSLNNYIQHVMNGNPADGRNLDAFITMFSNDGTKTYWSTWYGGPDANERGNSIAIDGNDNLYVVGCQVSPATESFFPLFPSVQAGAYNDTTYGTAFILEFNLTNAFIPSVGITRTWATRIGDTNHTPVNSPTGNFSYASLNACTIDASNNFYVTGSAYGYGYTSPNTLTFPYKSTQPEGNAVVTKFNSTNNVIWSSYYGGNAEDQGYAIAVDQGGNTFITGNATSDSAYWGVGIELKNLGGGLLQSTNGDPVPNDGNAFIAEFNSSGIQLWGTYLGGSGASSGRGLSVDAHHDLYFTGTDYATDFPMVYPNAPNTYRVSSYITGNSNVGDGIIVALNNITTQPFPCWSTYFGSNQPWASCLAHSNNADWLYIVGNLGGGFTPQVYPAGAFQLDTFYFQSSPIVLGTSFISQFDIDPVISLGINGIKRSLGDFTVYPNPTSHSITVQVESKQNQDVEFILYNLMGEMVYDKKLSEQSGLINQEIDLSLLSNGIYLLRVNQGNTFSTKKIIKQN